jgi:tetratricopeptide (TPR) repeat protein
MNKLFKKKEIFKVKSVLVDPSHMAEPKTVDDFQKRGMAYYARKQYKEAEADLTKAIELDATNIDSYYSLGMVLKANNCKIDSIAAFKKVVELIHTRSDASTTKYDMLRRLALGHINELTEGDWNLEKEIWKRVG